MRRSRQKETPVLQSLAADYAGRVKVCKVDADEQLELARRYEVTAVPTLLVFAGGELRRRMVGVRSRSPRYVVKGATDGSALSPTPPPCGTPR